MALVSKKISHFLNGVSQQPANIRLDTQGEVQENGLSNTVDGLQKRPPSQYLATLKHGDASDLGSDLFIHTYVRSSAEQYTIIIDMTGVTANADSGSGTLPKISIFNQDGTRQTNTGFTNQKYLAKTDTGVAPTAADLRAVSIADQTYIVNTLVNVDRLEPSGGDNQRPYEALFYLKQADNAKVYRIMVSSHEDADDFQDVFTSSSDYYEHGQLRTGGSASDATRTGTICNCLVTGSDPSGAFSLKDTMLASNLTGAGFSDFTTRRMTQSPFVIAENDTNDFYAYATDDNGNQDLTSLKDTCRSFTDLPKFCAQDFVIEVIGDNSRKEDNFYVVYEGTYSGGSWVECAQPSRPSVPVYHALDPATMPHKLEQNADLSFTFGQEVYDERKAGDDDTNPFPSFYGKKIADIFFFRNRLGVLSDENVIFSEAANFQNFFRTTTRSLLDSAPIDVAVSQNEVSLLKAAVPFQENLLMFSEITQFTLSATELLTPNEVSIDASTRYECDLTAKPVGAGNSVYFATKFGTGFAGIREYFTTVDTEIKESISITDHIPKYIPTGAKTLAASSNEEMLAVLPQGTTNELYIYKWHYQDNSKVQTSWSKWTFDGDIKAVSFNNTDLYVAIQYGSSVYLEKIELGDSTKPLLDRLRYFDSDTGLSDYQTALGSDYVMVDEATNQVVDSVPADLSADPIYIGVPYTFKYELSEQVYKDQENDVKLARFQMRRLLVDYVNTYTFDVKVTATGRDNITFYSRDVIGYNFSGLVLGSDQDLGADSQAMSGAFSIPVQSQANAVQIEISNASHFPSTITGAEWEGFIHLRSKRI